MLTNEDMKAIEACVRRPEPVWTVIKEIAIPKYDSYLSKLELKCNTEKQKEDLENIKKRWLAENKDPELRSDFILSEKFDNDQKALPKKESKNFWKMLQ